MKLVSEIAASSTSMKMVSQQLWREKPLPQRLRIIARVRNLLAEQGEEIAELVSRARNCPAAEALSSEILPLAAALKFLERDAPGILAPKKHGWRGRPLWLFGTASEVRREPLGNVLIVCPANYPLFLPGVQIFQALAAGNAVMVKPGRGAIKCALALQRLAIAAGLDEELFIVLSEEPREVDAALAKGVDKVFFTGSSSNGKVILKKLAPPGIPATMELSGCDAVFIRTDADIAMAAQAVAFGLRLNKGNTCIAPRRVFVAQSLAESFKRLLAEEGCPVALDEIHPVEDDEEALAANAKCKFALGASLFSRDIAKAREMAVKIPAGVVVINDLIVPTADPRLPFGGRKASGFGVTRGVEGLLEMTAPKVITVSHGKLRPHFNAPREGDAALFLRLLRLLHGVNPVARAGALLRLLQGLIKRGKSS